MLEELIEAVEMMDGRSLHQTDHARSKPWRCCYVPVISFRVFRVGTQGPLQAQVSRAGVLVTKRYLYCISVAAVGELFRRVGKLTQQWCPRESGKRKRRGHDTRRRRAARGAYVQSSFWNKKPQRGHISACTWVRERCYDPTESPRSPETARARQNSWRAYYTTRSGCARSQVISGGRFQWRTRLHETYRGAL